MSSAQMPSAPESASALQDLFERDYSKFLTFIRWRSDPALSARRDSEDILQSAYLQARVRWADYCRSGMALGAWFYRIILNCLFDDRDYHSRQQRDYRSEMRWQDRSSAVEFANPGTSPSEAAGRRELRERIDRVFGLLTPEHQEIMFLVHHAGLAKEQAGALLGIEGNAARQRYARARVKFREHWKVCFGSGGLDHGPGG